MSSPTRSKRQRLFDLVKTTKDVYIPTISNTLSQLANEATTRALNYTEETEVNLDTKGAQILVYPHFTRHDTQKDEFYTQVHGWVYSSEGSLRKKRIIYTLARQLTKTNGGSFTQLDEQLSQDDVSIASSSSGSIQGSLKRTNTETSEMSVDSDDVLKERIANFVNRSLGNTELDIVVGGEAEDMVTMTVLTDVNGNFNVDVKSSFKPLFIQVAISNNNKIFEFKDTIFPGESPYAVISDIDDTIKRTGVCGDKRSIFRNIFVANMETWEIPGAADTYRFLYQKYDIPFFYLSNSPYQLYSNLIKFMDLFEFPRGSIYLKKYSGNIFNSFMEPSHTRKKAPLERIMNHFDKKFFLIGDSSEQDLEAYTDIARTHPEQIAGIYIRFAEGSMRPETFKLLVDLLKRRNTEVEQLQNDINLIDLDEDLENGTNTFFPSEKKPPPPVPTKPRALQSHPTSASSTSSTTAPNSAPPIATPLPPLPRRPVPMPPARRPAQEPMSYNDAAHEDEESEEWISRILTSLLILKKVNVPLKLFTEFNEVQVDIMERVKDT